MFTVKRSATGFHNSISVTVILKSDKAVAPEGAESLLNHDYLSQKLFKWCYGDSH